MDTGSAQHRTRSKRAQYVNQACNECKRRKVKCDGDNPCQRCVAQSTSCIYPGRDRVPTTHPTVSPMSKISRKAGKGGEMAQQAIGAKKPPRPIRPALGRASVLSDSSQNQPNTSAQSAEFCGPSSSEFTLNIVSGNLKAMGMPTAILDKSTSGAKGLSDSSSRLIQYGPFMKPLTMDPLWEIQREDAAFLIRQWSEGVGMLYPVVGYSDMMKAAEDVFTTLECARREGVKMKKGSLVETIFSDETNKLKIVLAIGKTLESGGRNDQAQRLFQSTTEAVEGLIWNSNDIDGVQLLVLVAIYHYHLDDELCTGRIVSIAARLCMEMGLHRRSMVEKIFPNLDDRLVALQAFWSVYMLERRTSLGQGIPFSIQDSFIDPSLFNLTARNPLIAPLLDWTKLAGRIWHILNNQAEDGTKINIKELDDLDTKALQWYDQLAEDLKLHPNFLQQSEDSQSPEYIQAVLFFRKNHLRNLAYRPILQSRTQARQDEKRVRIAVKVANETLQTLRDLNDCSTYIRTHTLFFNHPLLTAFGNLLLVVVHAGPAFLDHVKVEFDIALNLINLLSTRSAPLMRLWKRLQGLRKFQMQLLTSSNQKPETGEAASTSAPPTDFSFEDLFPAFQLELSYFKDPGVWDHVPGDAIMRDHVNGLLDASVEASGFFETPSLEWG